MSRKGQYLAVESVLTLSIGLAVAVGTISIFSNYKDTVLETGKEEQVDMVQARVSNTVYALENVKRGTREIDLPENLGGEDYQMVMDEGITIVTANNVYKNRYRNLLGSYTFSGRVESGGSVKIFKRENEYILRGD